MKLSLEMTVLGKMETINLGGGEGGGGVRIVLHKDQTIDI